MNKLTFLVTKLIHRQCEVSNCAELGEKNLSALRNVRASAGSCYVIHYPGARGHWPLYLDSIYNQRAQDITNV